MIKNLVLVAMMVLALAGTAFAQTSPGATDQPSTASSAQGDPTSPPPADTTGSAQAEPAAAPQDSNAPAPAAPAGQAGLPATAGGAPLTFAIGVASIVAFFGLLLYRRRPIERS